MKIFKTAIRAQYEEVQLIFQRIWEINSVVWIKLSILLSLFMLLACDGDYEREGLHWTPPADKTMPLAFAPEEKVPYFARLWHMPHGFQGFTGRWNERARNYVDQMLASRRNECQQAFIRRFSSCPASASAEISSVGLRSSLQKCMLLGSRRQLGDYLVFRDEKALPKGLRWQDGSSQPDIGSPAAIKGGSLRLGLQRAFPNTLCPFGPNSNNATRRYIYDDIDMPLIRIHPSTGMFIPGTADRWAISEDGRTVYFHIDKAARFTDGSRLTTRDFVTALYVRTSSYSAEPFYGDFYLSNFSRIAIYGNHVLAITLPYVHPAAAFYAIVPASCTRFYSEFGPDYASRYLWRYAPTTGAYSLDPHGLILGRQMTLSRVKDWWAKDRKYTRYSANVDHIVYSFISEPSKLQELFRIGELDVLSARDADFWYEGLEIDAVHRGYIQRIHFSNIWPRNSFGFHLNCSRPPFNDRDVRLGVHHALNIQAVINTIFRGDYTRMGSYFSGFGVYTDDKIQALPYSPSKAREYFAKAGYTEEGKDGILRKQDGTRLQIVVSSRIDPLYANCMNLLREDAARCGVDLRLEQMDDTLFFTKVKDKQYSASIFSWGFSPILPSPAQFFLSSYAYLPDGTPARGTANITATASPDIDAAILSCQTASTVEQAIVAHHRLQQLIADYACWVPGWGTSYWRFAQWRWLRWPDTEGCRFCPPRYYDPLDSQLYWIDPRIKRETQEARSVGKSFPELEVDVPLPEYNS